MTIDVNRAKRRLTLGSDQGLVLMVCLVALLGVAGLFAMGA
jgi:hypothetical protein